MSQTESFAFDSLGSFEIHDPGLLAMVAAGAADPGANSNNRSCYNDYCENFICVAIARVGINPDVPNIKCDWPDFACGPLTTC